MQSFIQSLITKYEKSGYRFDIHPDNDIYDKNKKNLLFLSHIMNRTGAPLALLSAARVLREKYNIFFATIEAGELSDEIIKEGYMVVALGRYFERKPVFKSFAKSFDAILVNTVLNFPACMILSGTQTPVIWWLHEHEHFFEYGKGEIPNPSSLGENVKTVAVSPYVSDVVNKYFDCKIEELPLPLSDLDTEKLKDSIISNDETTSLICCGTYSDMKGQDLLVRAYDLLTDEQKNKLSIIFVGGDDNIENEYFKCVYDLSKKEKNVNISKLMPHEKLLELIKESDGVIIPSRYEPLPTIAMEALTLGRACVLSDKCGVSYYMKNDYNAKVFEANNVKALHDALAYLCENKDYINTLKSNAKKAFDENFGNEKFLARFEELI